MKLKDLLKDIIKTQIPDIEISGISLDSRNVKKGNLFFAINGNVHKGSEYIPDAIKNGASIIIGNEDINAPSVPYIKIDKIRENVALVASRYYSKKPEYIVAITGTNGKTSIASFVAQIFEKLEIKSATIGTLGVVSKDYNYDFGTTTPDAIEFHKSLQMLTENGVRAVAFEASSHGLDQCRVDNTPIKAAGFTNLTQDHLDYHKDMESYLKAKKRLFTDILPQDGIAILNADSDYFDRLTDISKKIWSYGFEGKDIKLISVEGQNIAIDVLGKEYKYQTKLVGDFQIMNSLCAIGLVLACGLDKDKVLETIPFLLPPAGRLDFAGKLDNGAEVYVDYAHTPDALEKAIKALRPYTKNKLSVVFGCGGDRDKTKRPKMGKVADEFADNVYVTDDNPRTEDADTIRKEVLAGCPNKGVDAGNRHDAIKISISNLKEGDILLLAGKGHEDYQIIGTTKHHFDDKEEAIKAINSINK